MQCREVMSRPVATVSSPTFLEDLKAYIGFTEADSALLRSLLPDAEPHLDPIATRFYEAITRHPGARRHAGGPEEVARQKATLKEWLRSGLAGPHGADFHRCRARIGRTHVRIELPQRYVFTSMNLVRLEMRRIVERALGADPERRRRASDAIDKLFDIELAIMLETYREDSEARLRAQERLAVAGQLAALATLSAGLAHEVRNPLNAARLQLDLLERRIARCLDSSDPALTDPVRLVKEEIARLASLVEDFLQFARPPRLFLDEIDVGALARDVLDKELPEAAARGVDLRVEAEAKSVVVSADPAKLRQVLINLVRNAVEAIDGQGEVVVVVEAQPDRGCRVRVCDTGCGIADEDLPRIFEPFFSTKPAGTGLGMSICHSLISQHGGALRVAPRAPPGFSTVLEVSLPATPPAWGERSGRSVV